MQKAWTVCVLLFSLCFFWTQAEDIELVGIEGEVRLSTPASLLLQRGQVGDFLLSGDELKTQKNAWAHIRFADGQTLLLKPESSILIFMTENKIMLFLKEGEFLLGFTRPVFRRKFEVRTPAAVVGVADGLFIGKSDKNLNSSFVCLKGHIVVWAEGITRAMNAQESLSVLYGQSPAELQKIEFKKEDLQSFAIGGQLQSLQKLLP